MKPVQKNNKRTTNERSRYYNYTHTYLVSYVRLEVFVRRYVHTHAPVFERRSRHLVRRAGHGRHHHVRDREAPHKV